MPLFHISGFSILVRSVLYGMEVRLYEKFDAVKVADEIREGFGDANFCRFAHVG